MAVSTSSLESIAGNLLFRCGLCQKSDMPFLEGFFHCLQGHSGDQTQAYNIQCADCSLSFPCKAFFMLPCLHSLGCRMQPDGSSRSVSATTSGSILLFDAEEIQDVQSVANPSRTLPDTTVLQFGDYTSLAEDGGVSAISSPPQLLLKHHCKQRHLHKSAVDLPRRFKTSSMLPIRPVICLTLLYSNSEIPPRLPKMEA